MKAILEFNLPDDTDELKLAQRGGDYFCVIMEIRNIYRNHEKYGSPKTASECLKSIMEAVNEAKTDDIS
jgi:hypothetical protein